ncbi:MAG: DUF3108 domain-containing protein [Hyphomonadaceae bacterium]
MRVLLGTIAALFVCAQTAHAETYRLNYEAVVLGVVVLGEARYEVDSSTQGYTARATLRTSGLARLFDQTDITANAAGSRVGAGLTWSRYSLDHRYASKSRRIQMQRSGGHVNAEITPRYGNMGVPPTTEAQQDQSYDPLTAVFALGSQVGAARGCRGGVLVFDGRQHYRLSVSGGARGTFNGGGYSGPALSCQFRYEPIAGHSADFNRSNIPAATAWFALPEQAGFAAPLRLTVPTPLGDAQLDLRGYQHTR